MRQRSKTIPAGWSKFLLQFAPGKLTGNYCKRKKPIFISSVVLLHMPFMHLKGTFPLAKNCNK